MSDRYSQTPPPVRRDRQRVADTPIPSEEWFDRQLDKPLFSATPAPLRQIAARMNGAAIGVVHTATSMFMWIGLGVIIIGVLFVIIVILDFGKHHLFGYWPADPNTARLEQVEADYRAQNEELFRLRAVLGQCVDQSRPRGVGAGEEAQ